MGLKIIPNSKTLQKIIEENSLQLIGTQIFLNPKNPDAEKNNFDDVIDYFTEYAAETKNIFIKSNGNLHEIPFVNGISFDIFSRLLKGYEISDDAEEIKKIIAESFLDLRDNKIYFHSEENISADFEFDLQELSEQSLEFLKENEDNLKIISVIQGTRQGKIPFVEGIPVNIFAPMLRELKILGKNAKVQKFLANNKFTVKDNLVYKKK